MWHPLPSPYVKRHGPAGSSDDGLIRQEEHHAGSLLKTLLTKISGKSIYQCQDIGYDRSCDGGNVWTKMGPGYSRVIVHPTMLPSQDVPSDKRVRVRETTITLTILHSPTSPPHRHISSPKPFNPSTHYLREPPFYYSSPHFLGDKEQLIDTLRRINRKRDRHLLRMFDVLVATDGYR